MNQYKLSYNVGGHDKEVFKIANNEIELAANILDMERDVGMICHNVRIETGDFDENLRSNQKQALADIQRWAKVLMTASWLGK